MTSARHEARSFRSTCSYCGVGCGLIVETDGRGRLKVRGDPEHPVNRGMLCAKGLTLAYAMEDCGDRLRHPELRETRSDLRRRVSWDDAITHVAERFRSIIGRHGPDAVGFYVSGQCLTEEYYLANKLVKGFLGTNNIDTNSRLCMSSAAVAYAKTLGADSVPICYEDIELSDCIFIAGANPAWCHPILFRRIEEHRAANPHVRVIVADPRRTESCGIADVHLPVRPGTDVTLHHAIARVLIERDWIDRAFVQDHVDGFDEYRRSVFALSVGEAAERCGVSADQIVRTASLIARAKGFLTLWAMGLNQSAMGVDKNVSLIALNLITGKIGKPGSGPFSLTGQPNAMGGREVGGMATLLAGRRSLSNDSHRKEVAAFWGVGGIQAKPGLTAVEMFDAMEDGRLKAVWVIATNPMVSLPDARRAERALGNAEFVVVQDISRRPDTLRFADVVLPAAGHFEKDGTMTNSERRIGYLEKVVDPPGEALPDSEILMRFARAMGFHGFDFADTAAVYAEHARLTAGTDIDISGLSHARLRAEGTVQWPAPAGIGTARLFTDGRFHTANGRAKLIPVDAATFRSEPTSSEYPLVLTTGRIRDQWHTMTKTGKVRRLSQHAPRPFAAMHPEDATARGIEQGGLVRLWNGRGEMRVPVEITEDIRPGVVFVPMHWGRMGAHDQARANNLTARHLDPESKEPDFKHSVVQAESVRKNRERIVVVGAGAAAYRFVHAYRTLNASDEIHLFTSERDPFYDRVRLSDYVSQRSAWHELLKFRTGELEALDLRLHTCTPIERIDRKARAVIDSRGHLHAYDRLVVATGSRAFLPPSSPVNAPGVLTMRTRADAEDLKERVRTGSRVLVVGGGLLGLELATTLIEVGAKVTIVERSARLMERELDATASELLANHITAVGIDVRLQRQVEHIASIDRVGGAPFAVELSDGTASVFDAVVVAIGTTPNVEILRDAGIACGHGAIVNDQLQSSDPLVYAMGEVAEHRGEMYRTTAAAEEQAEVVARHIAGDVLITYDGSVRMNVLKLAKLDLCSIGVPHAPAGESGYEEITFLDRAEGYYKKCVIKDDRLVGAILLGDKSELAEFRELVASGLELGESRQTLLRGGRPRPPVDGRLVCACGIVGEGNIEMAIGAGCTKVADVCAATGAGVGCGSCMPEIRRILDRMPNEPK